jgi:hypothetical protein
MVKVRSHSAPYRVQNPAKPGQWNTMINVVFIEENRPGANRGLTGSSSFLSQIVGEEVGLQQVRTHTQPVLADTIDKFPVDKEFPGHINRSLYSFPQIQNQQDKAPRMIDGKPTYFVTALEAQAKEDLDYRLPLEVAATIAPKSFSDAILNVAEVQVLSADEEELVSKNEDEITGDRAPGTKKATRNTVK